MRARAHRSAYVRGWKSKANEQANDRYSLWLGLASYCMCTVYYQPATPNHQRPTLSYTSAIMGVTSPPNNGKQ